MNWITYLKVLFDQLESFTQNKQKHVEKENFIKALQKIKNLLPLQTKNDYLKTSSDISFTYLEVETGIYHMPKFINWDNVIDVFLTKQNQYSFIHPTTEVKSNNNQELDDDFPIPVILNESVE